MNVVVAAREGSRGSSRFCITQPFSGRFAEVPITQEEFKEHLQAKDFLSRQLEIERRYDLLIGNYLDLQEAMYRAATQQSVRFSLQAGQLDELSRPIHRVFFNFLASARAYTDQVHVLSSDATKEAVTRAIRKEYDDQLSYRLIDALRNHSVHYAIPLSVAFTFKWIDRETADKRLVHKIQVSVKVSELALNAKFKKSLLKELQSLGQ